MMSKPKANVVAAVIKDGDRYLCMQRTRSQYPYISERWEFPGGKMEEGETEHEALLREIKEEMDWNIYVGRKLATLEYEYPDFITVLHAYLCKGGEGEFKMFDHLDYKWLTLEELPTLSWTDADRMLIEQFL